MWWSLHEGRVAALSRLIIGQVHIFTCLLHSHVSWWWAERYSCWCRVGAVGTPKCGFWHRCSHDMLPARHMGFQPSNALCSFPILSISLRSFQSSLFLSASFHSSSVLFIRLHFSPTLFIPVHSCPLLCIRSHDELPERPISDSAMDRETDELSAEVAVGYSKAASARSCSSACRQREIGNRNKQGI